MYGKFVSDDSIVLVQFEGLSRLKIFGFIRTTELLCLAALPLVAGFTL